MSRKDHPGAQPQNTYNLRSKSRLPEPTATSQSNTTTVSLPTQSTSLRFTSRLNQPLVTRFHAVPRVASAPQLDDKSLTASPSTSLKEESATFDSKFSSFSSLSQSASPSASFNLDLTGFVSRVSTSHRVTTPPVSPRQTPSPSVSPTHIISPVRSISPIHTPDSPQSLSPPVSPGPVNNPYITFIASDSEDELTMASAALMPSKFHGLSSEDATNWFRDLEHYCAYKKLDDAGKVGLVPLLLQDGARCWYDSLDDNTKNSFANTATAFRNYFKRDEAIKWKDSADVWAEVQLPNQSVEDYISQLHKKAQRANMTEEQIRSPLIKGLLPEIRQSVLQHDTTSIAEIKRWAIIAESALTDTRDNVTAAIKRLENKLDRLETKDTNTLERTRSQSPRVRFQENSPSRNQYRDFGSPQRNRFQNTNNSQRANNNQQRRYESNYRPQNGSNQNNRGRNWNRDGRRFSSNRASTEFYNNRQQQPQQQQQQQQREPCFRCGLSSFHDKFSCPALHSQCHNCGVIGHYSRVCRRRRQQ